MIFRLRSYHGGLGDELQFSTLPEMLSLAGHEVYLLKDPEGKQVLPFRNPEIKQLVWDTNPYIKGELEGEWNLGDIPGVPYRDTTGQFIRNWEQAFSPVQRISPNGDFWYYNVLPKIYFEPKRWLAPPQCLIELSAISLKYNSERVREYVTKKAAPYKNVGVAQLVTPNQKNHIHIPGIEEIHASSLKEVYSLLCSVGSLITLNSGVHALSAAAKRYNDRLQVECLLPENDYTWIVDSTKFIFPSHFQYVRV